MIELYPFPFFLSASTTIPDTITCLPALPLPLKFGWVQVTRFRSQLLSFIWARWALAYVKAQFCDTDGVKLAGSCICGCGGSACIPQREYHSRREDRLSLSQLQELISFSVNRKCGYPLEDGLRKVYNGLDGRDDKMVIDSKACISIRVEVCPSPLVLFNSGLECRS